MAARAVTPSLEQRLAARRPGQRSPVLFQSWRHLLFLHWKVDAEALQAKLPPGLSLDLFGGEAYAGIVPFFMQDVRPRFLPCAPVLSNFLELNVRTYVHDADGVPGVWFFSLDANLAPAVWLGRGIFKLPYRHAKMRATVSPDGWTDYESRCGAGNYDGSFRYRGTGTACEAAAGTLEFFLLERYFLYAFDQRCDTILRGQVAHAPYQFRQAELERFDVGPLTGQGIHPLAADHDHACVAEGVRVEILGLQRFPTKH